MVNRSILFWKGIKDAKPGFREKPMATGLALAAATLIGGSALTVALDGAFGTSSADAAALAAAPLDLDGVLDARSPGHRRYGWLLDTKQARIGFAANPDLPSERVLSSTRRRPTPVGVPGAPVPLGVPNGAVDAVPAGGIVPESLAGLGNPGAITGPDGIVGGPGLGGVLPGGGGGSGGDNPDGGSGVITTPETPIPAVPEPATWAMLLLGFTTLGAAMRWQRSPLFARGSR